MDRCLAAVVLFALCNASAMSARLDTPRYLVTVIPQCVEGEVVCDEVSYYGRNKLSGAEILLRGETVHRLCADGETPCRLLGYLFRGGGIDYFVGIDGWLRVTDQRGRVLLQEQGSWVD